MTIPEFTQELTKKFADLISSDPAYRFTHSHRKLIYESFGPSNYPDNYGAVRIWVEQSPEGLNLTKADRAFAWLAFITAKKVLPIWDDCFLQAPSYLQSWYNFPYQMIQKAEDILNNRTDLVKSFYKVIRDFHQEMVGIEFDLNERACWACHAVYFSVESLFLGVPGMDDLNRCADLIEEDLNPVHCDDFARMAARAYSAIDHNPMVGKRQLNREGIYQPVRFDPAKRLEFWQWWLGEAIPQAWELAEA